MKKNLLIALLILTSFTQNQACALSEVNQNVFSIKTKLEGIEIDKEYIEVYKDSANSLTIEEISSNNFNKFISVPNHKDDFRKNINYWLKFQIENISKKRGEWVLEFRDIPFLDIFIVDKSGKTENLKAGVLVPASEKQMNSGIRETAIFTLQANEIKTNYVKIHYLFTYFSNKCNFNFRYQKFHKTNNNKKLKNNPMELPFLRDPEIYPSDDVLEDVLGTSYPAYVELTKQITNVEFGLEPQWRYYKDGKAWLCKVCYKKKTVFWLSVWDKHFKVAFYFTEKTKPGILELKIKEEIKESFLKSKPIGKLIPLVIEIREKDQIPDVNTVAGYKKKLK